MIEFKQATKKYGDKVALNNLNLTIESGEIVGLIGHNGAGKSTTIKSLVSILPLTSGTIEVDGVPLSQDPLTINEFWELIAVSYQLTMNQIEERLTYLLELFDFTPYRYDVIESFSHGMRQKVFVIGALLSDPDIWILDEPLTGLDPQAAYDLKKMMREHAEKGKTVLFSTHVLEVAEQLCDRIAILKKGELLFYGTIEELKEHNPQESLESIYLSLAGRKEGETVDESASC